MLFETGTVFLGTRNNTNNNSPEPELLFGNLDQDSFSIEKPFLSGVMGGVGAYSAFDYVPKAIDFYTLKGVVGDCLRSLGLDDRKAFTTISYKHGAKLCYMHPGESARLCLKDQERPIGHLGKIHPDIALVFDISPDIFVFELDLCELVNASKEVVRFSNFSRYPVITRDVALLASEEVKIGDILAQAGLVSNASEILHEVSVFDIYRGKNIPAGKKSVALSLILQKSDRTLTDEEAENFVNEFLRLVEQETKAQVR